jgi:hypothetical protein
MSEQKAAALAKLQAALWSGARSVTIDGQSVQFSSPAELRLQISKLERELGATRARSSRRVAIVRPGAA